MTTPKKNDPLTPKEMEEAAAIFFPLFRIVHGSMPKDSTTEDALKVMETVSKLAHKRRADKADKEKELAFGFNKQEDNNDA